MKVLPVFFINFVAKRHKNLFFFQKFFLQAIYMQETINPTLPRTEHKKIREKLSLFRHNYKNLIDGLALLGDFFAQIPFEQPVEAALPYWSNIYLPPGDAIALCAFLVKYNPVIYMEVGSGNSTKFARRVISHFNLRTKIISIDPQPRAEIDSLCDEIVREPLQTVPVSLFQTLHKDNILFIDGSHKCLQNSDVTFAFLEVLPVIKPGVLLHFHDIFWPADYPPDWAGRFYNEQYLLAVYLLFCSDYEILYSSAFVACDPELSSELEMVLYPFLHNKCAYPGGSFWMRLNPPPNPDNHSTCRDMSLK
jgi:hypothetical protein